MAVTINDVAKEAGVSITTVSRVMNNNYPVRKETRESIEKAIKKLRYKPNIMARSLITKRSSLLGVIIPGITNLFFSTIVEEIEASIKNKGYSISLCNTGGDFEEEKKLIENIISRQVDGIIVIDPTLKNLNTGYYEEISKRIPTIIVNGSGKCFKCNFVCYDEEFGAEEAFKYLLQLNHKKIAFIRGTKSFSYDIKENVYNRTIDENKLNYKKVISVGEGNSISVVNKAQKETKILLQNKDRPSAIFACNDLMAVGAINACNELKLKVPQAVSVIGCDNTFVANITNPRLTSIDLGMKTVGRIASQELLNIIENGFECRKKIILDTKLIIRESCSKARKIV